MAAAVSSSVRSAQKRSSAPICLRTRRKRRSSASVPLASAADGHSEGQWTPNRLGGEHSWKSPSTLRPRAPWGWFWGWVPSHGGCLEAPRRAKRGCRRGDLRRNEVDRWPFSAGGGGATPSQRTAAQSLVKQKSGCQSLVFLVSCIKLEILFLVTRNLISWNLVKVPVTLGTRTRTGRPVNRGLVTAA